MDSKKTKIKICGITAEKELKKLNELKVDYAGFVLFFEKSKRNNRIEYAKELIKHACGPKTVAVTVSPTLEQVGEIEEAGFDILQVHGILSEEVKNNCHIPIWRAFNISSGAVLEDITEDERISGVVIDGAIAGSGQVFDWEKFLGYDTKDKLFVMAGGLKPENVADAIRVLKPNVVDVSSGVEYIDGIKTGKDLDRIESFVRAVRQ